MRIENIRIPGLFFGRNGKDQGMADSVDANAVSPKSQLCALVTSIEPDYKFGVRGDPKKYVPIAKALVKLLQSHPGQLIDDAILELPPTSQINLLCLLSLQLPLCLKTNTVEESLSSEEEKKEILAFLDQVMQLLRSQYTDDPSFILAMRRETNLPIWMYQRYFGDVAKNGNRESKDDEWRRNLLEKLSVRAIIESRSE